MKRFLKTVFNAFFGLVFLPVYFIVEICSTLFGSEDAFLLFSHAVATSPGKIGEFTRRAYYRLTLKKCGSNLVVGYGSFFTHRDVELDDDVWIGQYTTIGRTRIGSNVLISDHVSLLSGRHHHRHREDGKLSSGPDEQAAISIGDSTWIGAGSVIMTNVGEQSIVGGGSVVVQGVEPFCIVAGNPATLIRKRSAKDNE
ncbi:MAG: hypothetical protein KAX38_05925 [Candidatus Krumholzibacteria bacterium]|nr:hypothetical protein [Candidatus Krumholzibacteria bacterium]